MIDTREFIKEMRIVEFYGSEDEWPRWSKKLWQAQKLRNLQKSLTGQLKCQVLVKTWKQDKRPLER